MRPAVPRGHLRLVTLLGPAVLAAAAACGSTTDPGAAPAFAGPGRFVRDSVPVNVYRSCCHWVDLMADTLRFDAGGAVREVRVFHDVFSPYDPNSTPYDSTSATVWTGTWQASGSAVRVALTAGSYADTLRLVMRGDGGLQDTSKLVRAVYARR